MSVTVTVRFWAGARRAAGHAEETLAATDLADLRATIAARPALAKICTVASFLVNSQQAGENTTLRDGDTVDVLPPFAGGCEDARLGQRP